MDPSAVTAQIQKNHSRFQRMVQAAAHEKDETKAILLCGQAALFAVNYPCGILASPDLEKILLTIAQKYSAPLAEKVEEDAVLHILTRAYETGGHTRVCERWIEAESSKRHSVVLLNQGDFPIPEALIRKVKESGGTIETLPISSPLQTALFLREKASHFCRIVLSTHMHDVVPILAFGVPEFAPPVLYFNHADHLFWLGGMIADEVVNFRTMTAKNNPQWRGVINNAVLPLPTGDLSAHSRNPVRMAITKAELGVPESAKILITIASGYKYTPFAGFDFMKTVASILSANSNYYLVVIGPKQNDKLWQSLRQTFGARIKMMGAVPHQKLDVYLEIADVALESFPLGSPTALIDAVRFGIPCVSLRTPPNTYDAFEEAGIICATAKDYIIKALDYLVSPPEVSRLKEILDREASPAAFAKKITNCINGATVRHQIRNLQIDSERKISDFEFFIAHQSFVTEEKSKRLVKATIRELVYRLVKGLPSKPFLKMLYPALAKRLLA